MKAQDECNGRILDLAENMACTIGYLEDAGQFARLDQLVQAIEDMKALMEKVTNFIVKFSVRNEFGSFLTLNCSQWPTDEPQWMLCTGLIHFSWRNR